MALSKRERFEIFKRDAFICQYCGNRPPDVVLEVDHIDPRSKGGSDDQINLITACWDCNRGKSNKELGIKAVRPDADIEFLASQQEIAEAKRFLASREQLQQSRTALVAAIQDHWYATLESGDDVPSNKVIIEWLLHYTPEEITQAIDLLLPALRRKSWSFRSFDDYVKYVGGILRNRREDRSIR